MKKFYFSGIAILIALSMFLVLLTTPIIAAHQIITHPIETLSDFVSGVLGVDNEMAELSSENIQVAISTLCQNSQYAELLNTTVERYDASSVTQENIMKVFAFSSCYDITEENVTRVADYLQENMPQSLDIEQIVTWMESNSPFQESIQRIELNHDALVYMFTMCEQNIDDSDVDINPNSPTAQKIIEYAQSKLGARYYWGASGPKYFDCSGFVYWTHKQAGVRISRLTAAGYSQSGRSVAFSQIQVGDVITFNYGSGVAHIGIYIGNNKMIHASGRGSGTVGQYANQCVKITSIARGSYFYRYIYNCRRLY